MDAAEQHFGNLRPSLPAGDQLCPLQPGEPVTSRADRLDSTNRGSTKKAADHALGLVLSPNSCLTQCIDTMDCSSTGACGTWASRLPSYESLQFPICHQANTFLHAPEDSAPDTSPIRHFTCCGLKVPGAPSRQASFARVRGSSTGQEMHQQERRISLGAPREDDRFRRYAKGFALDAAYSQPV